MSHANSGAERTGIPPIPATAQIDGSLYRGLQPLPGLDRQLSAALGADQAGAKPRLEHGDEGAARRAGVGAADAGPAPGAGDHRLGTAREQRFRRPRDQRMCARKSGADQRRAAARADARAERGRAREVARRVSRLDRVRACGQPFPHGVAFRRSESGSCSVAGMSTCGSVWACPVCAHKVAVQRAMDLGRGIARWVAAGNSVIMATFTVSHQRTDALADVWGALQTAQRRVISGRRWQADQAEYRIAGYHRTTECTLNWENGWHPHYHVLYFIEGPVPDGHRLAALKRRLFDRWTAGLRRDGFDAGWQHGVDICPMKVDNVAALDGDIERALRENPRLAAYLSKSGAQAAAQLADGRRLALEALAHTGKTSQGGYTPFGLLGAIAELQCAAVADRRLGIDSTGTLLTDLRWCLARWREWESFSQGKRQVTVSRRDRRSGRVGLTDLLQLAAADVDDDVLAADDDHEQAEIVGVISAGDVRELRRHGVTVEELAAVLGHRGVDAVVALCDQAGVEFRRDSASIELWQHEDTLARRRAQPRTRCG